MTAFTDTNIPTYARGAPSGFKTPCIEILRLAAASPGTCVTNAQALQKLFHVRLRRVGIVAARAAVTDFDEALRGLVVAVEREDVLAAAQMDVAPGLGGADRVHLAVMRRLGITDLISTDKKFDGIPGVRRLRPARPRSVARFRLHEPRSLAAPPALAGANAACPRLRLSRPSEKRKTRKAKDGGNASRVKDT